MMERKRALTIQFGRSKDKMMENPLKIPTSYLDCGKFQQQQIPWATIASHKSRRRDSKRTDGAVLFDHSHAAMVRFGLKKSCVILTDILKTDVGKAYIEKLKRHVNGKESMRAKDLPMVTRDRQASQRRSTNSRNKSVSPKTKQTPDSSHNSIATCRSSSRSAKKPQTEVKENNKDNNENNDEVVSAKNEFELVDCGLSVTWEQENHGKSSAAEIKKPEPKNTSQVSLKRKANDIVPDCTETETPKRPRASVLRLPGVLDLEGEAKISPEKEAEDKDLKNTDGGIVQFTVGEGDKAAEPINAMSQDNGATTAIAEPIVLSSDDEECHEKGDRKIARQKRPSQKPMSPQQKVNPLEDLQVFQVLVNDHSDSGRDTCLCLAFSDLHCGPYHAKSNGDILITDENIIIPLKNVKEEMDLIITLERKQLRRYSVWNKEDLKSLKYFSDRNKSELPDAGLLCCVSEAAAEGVQYDLFELCDTTNGSRNTVIPSPFIVVFLQDSLEGMEGAYLRSLLDMDCLNSITQRETLGYYDQAIIGPGLSLDQSVELIKSSELDPHLLRLLDQGIDSTGADYGQESTSNCDFEMPKETVLKLDKTQPSPAAQPIQTPDLPPEKSVIEPVYTLCHRRLEDSYSVTMCKPDSSWVRYKHRGLARRLIQFPPPPMKGGITVTMEDLQCLDTDQYLNDVIIDFYLKYLLQNASESVANRSHIFSSFFYKQLTRRDNASEGNNNNESCQRQKRYQRVRTWTRHVDIFSKDFIFVPVNQEAHWYLVVICFPGLEEPKTETLSPGQDATNTEPEKEDPPNDTGPVSCTEQTCRRRTVCKRPCILVMDSLKRSPHERVFKLMREYLQSEWEARRGSSREFGPDQMESSHCQVPLQDNSSDCGLYLLHYVESFLKDPIVHFELPLHLKFWFPRQQVRRKREEIRDLILKLYRIQNMNVKT